MTTDAVGDCLRLLRYILIVALAILAVLVISSFRAFAHDNKALTDVMNRWAQEVELTPKAKLRLPWQKCCNHAEIIDSRYIVEPDGTDGWRWNDNGVMKKIPPDIIHWGMSAPNKRPTLFVYNGTMTCFFPGEGGL